jgi:hypothetical protein
MFSKVKFIGKGQKKLRKYRGEMPPQKGEFT